jgi:TPR repeat protein
VANKPLIVIFLILSLAMASSSVTASDLEDAVAAMRIGDFAEAYCIMRPLAEKGDADAQYNVGWMYMNGYGLRVNDSLALEWWNKASRQGHTDASFSIGMLYSLGDGDVPKDSKKAIDYYLLAVKEGHEDAITILQSMMMRNDKEIQGRMHSIIYDYGLLFGQVRLVKASKLNARNGPSVESKIVAQLVKGQKVLEMDKQGKWSQVAILYNDGFDESTRDRAVWVYNPLLESASSSN